MSKVLPYTLINKLHQACIGILDTLHVCVVSVVPENTFNPTSKLFSISPKVTIGHGLVIPVVDQSPLPNNIFFSPFL